MRMNCRSRPTCSSSLRLVVSAVPPLDGAWRSGRRPRRGNARRGSRRARATQPSTLACSSGSVGEPPAERGERRVDALPQLAVGVVGGVDSVSLQVAPQRPSQARTSGCSSSSSFSSSPVGEQRRVVAAAARRTQRARSSIERRSSWSGSSATSSQEALRRRRRSC